MINIFISGKTKIVRSSGQDGIGGSGL